MAGVAANKRVKVGMVNQITSISVSKEIAPGVKMSKEQEAAAPLFPTKNGYEYFVFRDPVRR